MTYNLIPDLARAYHCPQGVMAHIAHRHPALLATIEELGPMRIHWDREWGWRVHNLPVTIWRNASGVLEWRPTGGNIYGNSYDSSIRTLRPK